jgi:hypothetical protein
MRGLFVGPVLAMTATAAFAQGPFTGSETRSGTGLGGLAAPRPAAPAAAPAPAGDETDAITDSVKHWLTLIDRWQFGDSWGEAGVLLKSRITEKDWTLKLDPVRRPLGAMVKRTPIGQKYLTTLPGLPDGQYDVVRFNTVFEHKQAAVETVVLHKEDGRWRVNGYFIR